MECTAYPSVVSDFLSNAVSVVCQRTRREITAGGKRLRGQGECGFNCIFCTVVDDRRIVVEIWCPISASHISL